MGKKAAIKRFGWFPPEWICQPHWSLIPKAERRVWSRHLRQHRAHGFSLRPEAADRIWRALKRRAR